MSTLLMDIPIVVASFPEAFSSSIAHYKKGSFQLEFENTLYARRIRMEEEDEDDDDGPCPMIDILDKKIPVDGLKLQQLISITVDNRKFWYAPAETFQIPMKNASNQHAVYVQGALSVQYGDCEYFTSECPLFHVNKLTVGEVEHDSKRIRLSTPSGRHIMIEYVEKVAECNDDFPQRRKRARNDSELILQAKKKRYTAMLEHASDAARLTAKAHETIKELVKLADRLSKDAEALELEHEAGLIEEALGTVKELEQVEAKLAKDADTLKRDNEDASVELSSA